MSETSRLKVGDCSAASAMATASWGLVLLTVGESAGWAAAGPTPTAANTSNDNHFPIASPLRRGRLEAAPDEDAETRGELRQRLGSKGLLARGDLVHHGPDVLDERIERRLGQPLDVAVRRIVRARRPRSRPDRCRTTGCPSRAAAPDRWRRWTCDGSTVGARVHALRHLLHHAIHLGVDARRRRRWTRLRDAARSSPPGRR